MLCTERHVRKGTELAQVGFDPAALLMLVKSTVKFLLTKKQERLFYQYLSFKSIYLLPFENDKPLCKSKLFFFTHTVYLRDYYTSGTLYHDEQINHYKLVIE